MPMSDSKLIRIIQRNLSPDLLKPEWRGNPNPFYGHCYVASEALYHLGAKSAGFGPCTVRTEFGVHWYLRRGSEIRDPTAKQFTSPPDYDKGRGCGFLTRGPSKRTKILIERILGDLPREYSI